MNPWLLSISIAYLLGSIPFGYLLVRIFLKEDIRDFGSGNIGATNVARTGAKGLGIATLLLDFGKAYAAVLLARYLAPAIPDLAFAAAIAVVVGHCFPVWLRFRGGKGVASSLGVYLALSWPIGVAIFVVFLIVLLLSRYVSLGSVLGAASVPLFGLHFIHSRSPLAIAGLTVIPIIIILKHHANIRRLLSGTENRFGAKKVTA